MACAKFCSNHLNWIRMREKEMFNQIAKTMENLLVNWSLGSCGSKLVLIHFESITRITLKLSEQFWCNGNYNMINSLFSGRCGCNFKSVILKHNLEIDILNSSNKTALRWMPPNLSDDKFAPVLGNVIILTNVWLVFNLWPLLLTWFNFNPSMDK